MVRGQALGVLSLATTRRLYDAQDLTLAQELARQAALALDNARLYHEAQQAVRLRDEFLSIASHELKTPLTALQLQLQSLLSHAARARRTGRSPERLRRSLDDVDRQVHRLTQLVNDLLDVSRISPGGCSCSPSRWSCPRWCARWPRASSPSWRGAGCRSSSSSRPRRRASGTGCGWIRW